MKVSLSPNEVHLAASHAIMRRFEKLKGLRSDRQQKEQSTWDNEINGCCAELAVAKISSQYWTGVTKLKAKDTGALEVRWTKHQGTGGLIMYEHDEDNATFVLVDGVPPDFNIVGYANGREAKQQAVKSSFGLLLDRKFLRALPNGR